MSGLYNALFWWNPACVLLAPMLTDENPEYFFPRFRDCYLSYDKEHIEIFTRVGGGNRDEYEDEIEDLRSMPTYVSDEDDDFDCTYATFTFSVPEEWRADFEHVKAQELDELSDAYVERMQTCYPKLDIRKMLDGATEKPEGGEHDG